jgi:uncharacterized protein (TIGR02265 family)
VTSVAVDFARAVRLLDLDRRLELVPPSANSRGIFFGLVEHELSRRGYARPIVRSLVGEARRSVFALYPTRDLLVLYAKAGALLDQDPAEGIRQLFSRTATYYASTWYGHAFRRLLRPDPATALRYVQGSREIVADYGAWRLEQRGPCEAIMHMADEYLWIESAQRGGCEGMLAACGVHGEVRAELDAPFRGRLFISWRLPA